LDNGFAIQNVFQYTWISLQLKFWWGFAYKNVTFSFKYKSLCLYWSPNKVDILLGLHNKSFYNIFMDSKCYLRLWFLSKVLFNNFKSIFMPPPFEEWWRGIKCYPCPCVRESVRLLSKFGVPSRTFERLHRFDSYLVCLYKTSKHRSSSISVTTHWFLTELWAFHKNIAQKLVSAQ